MSRESEHRLHQEVIGLLLLGAGTLLFLALLSYDANDLPSTFFLASSSSSNRHAHNFIGIAGAYIGGILYFLFGAASFLIAAILFGMGTLKLIKPDALLVRRLFVVRDHYGLRRG